MVHAWRVSGGSVRGSLKFIPRWHPLSYVIQNLLPTVNEILENEGCVPHHKASGAVESMADGSQTLTPKLRFLLATG